MILLPGRQMGTTKITYGGYTSPKIQKSSEDFKTELISIYKQNTIHDDSLSRNKSYYLCYKSLYSEFGELDR